MSDAAPGLKRTVIPVAGLALELFEAGQGDPVLFLHETLGVESASRCLAVLAERRRLIAPSHPGFGASALPDWIDSVDDIAHLYLDLIDRLGLARLDLIGCSIGGWIAADIATKIPDRLRRLVLVGPVGVKVGPPDRLDIPDIFAMAPDKADALVFHDPGRSRPKFATMTDTEVQTIARNQETLALLTWEPYMHNPKLRHRLYRVTVPTLLVRGESDGIVSAQYLEGYAALFPDARTEAIANAGHLPQLEQPGALAATILRFLDGHAGAKAGAAP
jgi:pimeloyl-ACP methyl ester carboxylesterase